MLFKNLIPLVGCLLGATRVLADQQNANEHSNVPRAITSDNADSLRDDSPDHISVHLWSEPDFEGQHCTIDQRYLKEGKCLNLPKNIRVKSVSKDESLKCCLLYRSPCPVTARSQWHTQVEGFFHQKVFYSVNDLTPYGFTDNPLSIVCPKDEICNGFLLDRNWSEEERINIAPWWIDYRAIPGRKYI